MQNLNKYKDELLGENIIIRKAQMTDLNDIYENVYGDKELLSTMFLTVSDSIEDAETRLLKTIEYQKNKMLYFVALKETNQVIGLCGIEKENDLVYAEAGLAIGRKYQGKGYATEMLSLLLDYAFELGAKEFAYYAMDFNLKSKNLAKHFGFKYDKTDLKIRPYDLMKFNIERYVLTKEDYLKYKNK